MKSQLVDEASIRLCFRRIANLSGACARANSASVQI